MIKVVNPDGLMHVFQLSMRFFFFSCQTLSCVISDAVTVTRAIFWVPLCQSQTPPCILLDTHQPRSLPSFHCWPWWEEEAATWTPTRHWLNRLFRGPSIINARTDTAAVSPKIPTHQHPIRMRNTFMQEARFTSGSPHIHWWGAKLHVLLESFQGFLAMLESQRQPQMAAHIRVGLKWSPSISVCCYCLWLGSSATRTATSWRARSQYRYTFCHRWHSCLAICITILISSPLLLLENAARSIRRIWIC